MGYDECYNCMQIKYVKKSCEHWCCKDCKKTYITINKQCIHCLCETNSITSIKYKKIVKATHVMID